MSIHFDFKYAVLAKTQKFLAQVGVAGISFAMTLGVSNSANAIPAQYPLFIANPVKPIMVLNMSKDHQLFFKLYDDYSDIVDMRATLPVSSASSGAASSASSSSAGIANPNYGKSGSDGVADTTYIHRFRYYGYFDSDKCYTYANGLFSPSRFVDPATRYCNYTGGSDEWSGNLLNWASMTRLDAVRKILYGGKRHTDTVADTVLERAFIPEDAHAFAKYYNGSDIASLTPFTVTGGQGTATSGITFCNVTSPLDSDRNKKSQDVSRDTNLPPLLKVARGNFSLWGANEGYQCRWDNGTNDNRAAETLIQANASSPKFADDKLGIGNFNVRVKVCVNNLMNEANEEGCRRYGNNSKPIGLLQEYGEKDAIHFGLITGSYLKNKSGGVLRKNVGSVQNELNLTTGQIEIPANTDSIIGTLNALTIVGYDYNNGQYNSSDSCPWGISSFNNGACTNWGNPQSEIYLESMRYLAGLSATSAFVADDSSKISGLRTATWSRPVTNGNYCAPLNILQFNASTSSYDKDELSGADSSLLKSNSLNALLDGIGSHEGISGNYFVGYSDAAAGLSDELCTPKAISALSSVKGTCPDAPRLQGGYDIAALAYSARKNGIPVSGLSSTINGKGINTSPEVHTYGVALAPAVPKVEIPIPGDDPRTSTRRITILPACRNTTTNPNANCAIVDFKIVNQTHTGNTFTGRMYVNWEDSEQGGDYDQDMWGLIDYSVTNSTVTVSTRVFAQATDHKLGFGYVIGGTTSDGFKVQSGINDFIYGTACTSTAGSKCTCHTSWKGSCSSGEAVWRSQVFNVLSGNTNAVKLLERPLYYAAKWGGYEDDNALPATIAASTPKNYYYATDPRHLADSLRNAFNDIAERTGSSSGVATNSTSLNESSYLYQAVFNSDNWRGSLNAFAFDANGNLIRNLDSKNNLIPVRSTDTQQPVPSSRTIYTYNPGSGPTRTGSGRLDFSWGSLTTEQKDYLKAQGETDYVTAEKRFNWLRGSATDEVSPSAAGIDRLRSRGTGTARNIYADIVNSTPVYLGSTNLRYDRLPTIGSTYAAYVTAKAAKTPKVLVGANDGKLHVFNANTLQEVYAYVPNLVFPKLRDLTAQNYGKPTNPHQYLVDGPLTISDVHNGTSWRTIVVGTLGGGGRGVFALDVTDDNNPQVLFEISDADFPELGYVLGKPIIAPMANGKWAAIFGNGDSSGRVSPSVAAESRLFVVDIYNPIAGTKVLSTGSGRGLSAPAVLLNDLGIAKLVYAGDLNGQMWKFDVSDASSSNWTKSYKLYHAKDSSGREQPITAAPTLGINSSKNGAVAVYFGTGKYFDTTDHQVATGNPTHSVYAITDSLNGTVSSGLVQKTISNAMVGTIKTRTISSPAIAWASTNGWYMNFGTNEERIIAKPLLIADQLVFVTIIPSASSCDYGGASWLLSVPAVGDKFVNFTLLKDPPEETTMTLGAVGFALTKTEGSILTGNTAGNPEQEMTKAIDETTGRQSWRELD